MLQKSISLVEYSSDRGYELSSKAESFLLSLGGQHLAVLGIVGKARTGKSYIINQIINEQVFPVHSRINTCTRGILLSPVLRQDPATGTKYIVIDTEGIGGNDSTDDKDSKLFLLNMLMCSMLIYNGVGVIDEQALNGLSLIIGLGKSLHQDIEDEQNLNLKESSFPNFFWLIRDFVLKLQTEEGMPITPKQYLERALEEQKGVSSTITHKNRIRRVIKGFFKSRDCQTLIRPTDEEQLLYNLQTIPKEKIRQEFMVSIEKLRLKIFRQLREKKMKGCPVTGRILVNQLRIYIENLNGNSIPRLSHTWNIVKQVESKQIERAINQNLEGIVNSFNSFQDLSNIQKLLDESLNGIKMNYAQWVGDPEHLKHIREQFGKRIHDKHCLLVSNQRSRRDAWLENARVELSKQNSVLQLEQKYGNMLKKMKEEHSDECQNDRVWSISQMQARLENIYLVNKLSQLSKVDTQRSKIEVQLGFAKKETRSLAEKNLTLQKQRSTLIKTIESQEKSIEELRESVRLSKLEISSVGILSSQKKYPSAEECSIMAIDDHTTPPNNINIVDKVLQMYRRLEDKHSKLQSTLANCSALICCHCSEKIDVSDFDLHYEKCRQNKLNKELCVTLKGQSNKRQDSKEHMCRSSFTKGTIHISNPSFFTPYLIIPTGVLVVEVSKTLIKEDSQQRNYIEYTLDVKLHQSSWNLNRKYKDFCELHDLLLIMFPTMDFPQSSNIMKNSLLTAALGGNSSSRKVVVEERRKMLEEYIKDLLCLSQIRNTRIMQKFLKVNKQYQQLDYLDRTKEVNTVNPLKQNEYKSKIGLSSSSGSGLPSKLNDLRMKLSVNR